MSVYPVYKKLGQTPRQCIELYQGRLFAEAEKVTYAGRLDPLAEGVLLLLAGPTRLTKECYLSLPKKYVVDVLWGIETDSGDSLGLINEATFQMPEHPDKLWPKFIGRLKQVPPELSTPAFIRDQSYFADPDQLPATPGSRSVQVFSINKVSSTVIAADRLMSAVKAKIDSVTGNFRQERVLRSWQSGLSGLDQGLAVTRLQVRCGQGTYIRSLVRDLGRQAGTGATVLRLQRTQVGIFTLYNCL